MLESSHWDISWFAKFSDRVSGLAQALGIVAPLSHWGKARREPRPPRPPEAAEIFINQSNSGSRLNKKRTFLVRQRIIESAGLEHLIGR